LLAVYGIDVSGMKVTVVGRSSLVGKPLAALLLMKNATVTVCHSHTANLAEMTLGADMVVMAVGIPGMLQGHMVKRGAIVIDVGINVVDGKLTGDVDFVTVAPRASAITPVPKGVGPMTVAMLMENTLLAYEALTGCRAEGMDPLTSADHWAGAIGADLPRDPLFPTA
jgi:methylenetetrahydrofolate dehydrogenase (NADP+)/methenyltetrahydrofolate cyclohydrolase